MSTLLDYHKILVIQRQQRTGCIPSAIEWMLRYVKVKGIDFDTFQEKYDLAYQDKGDNHFGSIPPLIMQDYPHVSLRPGSFSKGKEKTGFIRDLINKSIPVLISIAMGQKGPWHIVPVVEIDQQVMTVLWMIEDTLEKQKRNITLTEIEFRHDNWEGGQDILYWDKQTH